MTPIASSFNALIPAKGFRWAYRDPKGHWETRQPPEDWSEADYRAASCDEDGLRTDLAERYFVIASTDECLLAHAQQHTEFGKTMSDPNLYLRFASERPTPAIILDFANRYGLLEYEKAQFSVRKEKAKKLAPLFDPSPFRKSHATRLSLTGETAFKWMLTFEKVRFQLETWAKLRTEDDLAAIMTYLEDGYNYAMGGSLTFQVKTVDLSHFRSEIVASSLLAALDVQWGMSVASNILHRQCAACSTWFAVHPGSGRPEKLFCSDACRMRAYRQRKLMKLSGSTNRSTKRKT